MTEHTGQLPAGTRPGRVALAVEDLYGASSFYEDVVGLTLFDYTDSMGRLGVGDTPLVELKDGSDRSPRTDAQAGLYHVAFEYPSWNALGSALQRVESLYELDGATDHGVSKSLYLTDPAGNGVELYVAESREEWPRNDAGAVVMETNPLDIDELRAAGAAEADAPVDTRIGHFHLEVADLLAATEFYRDTLGLPLVREIGDMARFFATGDAHHHLGVTNYLDRTDQATGRGVDWIEFLVPDDGTLAETKSRLVEAGVTVDDESDGILVTDPDGIGVRVRTPTEEE